MSNNKKDSPQLNEENSNLSRKKLFKTLSNAEKSRRRSTMSALSMNQRTNINPIFSFDPDVVLSKFNEKNSYSDGAIDLSKNKLGDEKAKTFTKKILNLSPLKDRNSKKKNNFDKDDKINVNRKGKIEDHSDLLLTSKLDKTKKKRLQKELDKLEKQKSKQENRSLQTLDKMLKAGMERALLPTPTMKIVTAPPARPPVLKA